MYSNVLAERYYLLSVYPLQIPLPRGYPIAHAIKQQQVFKELYNFNDRGRVFELIGGAIIIMATHELWYAIPFGIRHGRRWTRP